MLLGNLTRNPHLVIKTTDRVISDRLSPVLLQLFDVQLAYETLSFLDIFSLLFFCLFVAASFTEIGLRLPVFNVLRELFRWVFFKLAEEHKLHQLHLNALCNAEVHVVFRLDDLLELLEHLLEELQTIEEHFLVFLKFG